MDLDDLLTRYFGTTDIAALTPTVQSSGVEHILVDLGLEKDPGRRLALWLLLYLLGAAPDLDVAFRDEHDREAARNFMNLLAQAGQESGQ